MFLNAHLSLVYTDAKLGPALLYFGFGKRCRLVSRSCFANVLSYLADGLRLVSIGRRLEA